MHASRSARIHSDAVSSIVFPEKELTLLRMHERELLGGQLVAVFCFIQCKVSRKFSAVLVTLPCRCLFSAATFEVCTTNRPGSPH